MEDNEIVRFETDNGDNFEMVILKEFSYKDRKYAVLMDKDNCDCEDTKCECDDNCECGCNEEHECDCNENSKCECGCNDKGLYILEIATDKDNNEVFKEIEDEKLFDEIIEEADKVLYEI